MWFPSSSLSLVQGGWLQELQPGPATRSALRRQAGGRGRAKEALPAASVPSGQPPQGPTPHSDYMSLA